MSNPRPIAPVAKKQLKAPRRSSSVSVERAPNSFTPARREEGKARCRYLVALADELASRDPSLYECEFSMSMSILIIVSFLCHDLILNHDLLFNILHRESEDSSHHDFPMDVDFVEDEQGQEEVGVEVGAVEFDDDDGSSEDDDDETSAYRRIKENMVVHAENARVLLYRGMLEAESASRSCVCCSSPAEYRCGQCDAGMRFVKCIV